MRLSNRFPALALALLLAAACSDENGHPTDEGMPSGATCPSDSALDYENFGRTFMQNYCTRCHSSTLAAGDRNGAPSDHDFDSLVNIQKVPPEHIDAMAAAGPDSVNTKMPPNGARPTEAERRDLGEWLACGTP